MNDLISVIVPVYNVEKYLVECIDSIVRQSYQNLEILLIDDGSPDNCPAICDEYAKKDKRIKVIHQKNAGLSAARNTGIQKAKGKYICFIDSDDFIEKNYVKYLYELIIKYDADIAEGTLFHFYDDEPYPFNQVTEEKLRILTNKEAIRDLYNSNGVPVTATQKLYKKELFNNISYPIGKLHEDFFTTYKLYYASKKIIYSNRLIYFYRQRKGSINNTFNLKRLVVLEAIDEIEDFYKKHNLNDLLILNYKQGLNLVLRFYSQIKDKDIKKKLKQTFNVYFKKYKTSEGKKNKLLLIRYYLFIYIPFVDKYIIGLKRIINKERNV